MIDVSFRAMLQIADIEVPVGVMSGSREVDVSSGVDCLVMQLARVKTAC